MKTLKKLFNFLIQPRQIYFYILLAIVVPNVFLCFTEGYDIGTAICNVLLPLSVYAYIFTLRRRPGLMVWLMFPFIFLAAFQLVLLYLFGNSIIAVDMFLNLVTTNANEALELLDNLVPAVLGVFVLYIPILVFSGISIKRKEKLSVPFTKYIRRVALGGCLSGLLFMACNYVTDEDYSVKVDLFPLNVCYNCYLAVERTEDVAKYAETSKDFCYQAKPTHNPEQPEVYLFVIGETGRACNWELYGYKRNTTPLLAQQSGLVNFTDVLTQSNTTHKSVPLLLSMASAENFDRIYHEKSIITAFKEAGFYTAYFSNQKYNHAFIDIFGNEADQTVFLKEREHAERNINDRELVGLVDKLLEEGHHKLFIVLHTYGSHFNYRERYTKEFAHFQPEEYRDVQPKIRDFLINAYDNTIVQTDALLNRLIESLKGQHALSAMLYTSDHGEDIFDDNRMRFLHSSPIPTYFQLHVPFVVWTSEEYVETYPELKLNLEENRHKPISSNLSTVYTLMQLAGLETPYFVDSLSVASKTYHVSQRYYVNDHNLPGTYDAIGLDEEDFEQFAKHGNKL